MDRKKKNLVDRGEGEFILNESGTSVKTDKVEEVPKERSDVVNKKDESEEPYIPDIADEQRDNTD